MNRKQQENYIGTTTTLLFFFIIAATYYATNYYWDGPLLWIFAIEQGKSDIIFKGTKKDL